MVVANNINLFTTSNSTQDYIQHRTKQVLSVMLHSKDLCPIVTLFLLDLHPRHHSHLHVDASATQHMYTAEADTKSHNIALKISQANLIKLVENVN